ncbi:MAG: VanZ family protein [Anaeromyxobacter sp.]
MSGAARRTALALGLAAVAWAGLIAWLSSLARPPFPEAFLLHDKLSHGAGYAVLGALLAGALHAAGVRSARVLLLAAAVGSLYGVTDEWHQAYVPGRSSDPTDWAADTAGALAGAVAVTIALRRAGARAKRRPELRA